ncbi:hypothetical protein QO021_28695 (plasmid) [Pseudomonas amygdali pv. lachrymans]|uniref:hypothetical protein n=1 Tax=Pseudomonas amygdali TaxID=47877 RepID=UPI0006B96947|nr:hypothetical protein [Pseudomonas amygdali]RMM39189.1 hypothetical protein ALQ79_200455 [Pseudomonas amygdali pv. lachrymans]WIO61539.1 hypothetical protein QO021_28695 [Pseudomonas amygdali pv. lachrymans]
MKTAQATCLNLNQAFHLYNAQGVVRNVSARARVCIQGRSEQFVKVILLADYKTSYWDPELASAYAVAATFVLDGISERSYQKAVDLAIRQHGRGPNGQSQRSEMQALCDFIASGSAVCIQRDLDLIVTLQQGDMQVPAMEATLAAIPVQAMYDAERTVAGIMGEFTADKISQLVSITMGEGTSNFTKERLEHESQCGEHANWRIELNNVAA